MIGLTKAILICISTTAIASAPVIHENLKFQIRTNGALINQQNQSEVRIKKELTEIKKQFFVDIDYQYNLKVTHGILILDASHEKTKKKTAKNIHNK